jgi:hypothetical protein
LPADLQVGDDILMLCLAKGFGADVGFHVMRGDVVDMN